MGLTDRDRRLAERYREKGKISATERSRQKEAERAARRNGRNAPELVTALRNFDPSRPTETAVPRGEESVKRAWRHKLSLPRLG